MTPNADTLLKLTKARAALLIDQPFFGTLALRLKLVADNTVPTLAVDGRHVFYNESFIDGLTMGLVKSAVAHEVGHCVFEHISRRGARDPKRWNHAGDYVINDILQDAGFELGKGWLHNPAFKGMTADEVYNLLPPGTDDSDSSLCDIRQGTGEDAELDQSNWKVATVQAATVAKAAGKLPDSMKRFIDGITSPKVDWRAQLRRFVTEVSKNDYTWQRPNRRYVPHGFCLPSLYSESMGLLTCGIDTSGSIDQATLNLFGTEISSAWDATRPQRLVNIYCDAVVNHVDDFAEGEPLTFDLHGGGGTDLREIFHRIGAMGVAPACLLILTDGYTPFGDAPDYPVMWCMTTDVVAPFGETIQIGD